MSIDLAANAKVQRAIDSAILERGETGVQVAAYLNGKLVIDAWGGLADPAVGRRVDGDTLFNVFSVTKSIASTTIHIQAERGLVDYDAPIARYWREWGCNGKEMATVRDALTHGTGVPQMPEGVDVDAMCDWDWMVREIAKLTPIFPVGQRPAYQVQNFGWVLGEIVRRTDPKHRPYARFIQEELCQPLGIADLWIGIPDHVEERIAKLTDADSSGPPPAQASLLAQAIPNTIRLVPEVYEQAKVRRACIAATGGIFNARSEARFWAMLANGGELDGVRLLSKSRVAAACLPRSYNSVPDPVFFNTPMPLSQGGYWIYDPNNVSTCPAKGARAICVPGAGGSIGWADPDTGLAAAFCHNHMSANRTCETHPAYEIAEVIRSSLGLSNVVV
jgi:CubicO group peptidase (beta-lactamase class C family)